LTSTAKPPRQEHQLRAVLEADPPTPLGLQFLVENFHQAARQIARQQITPSLRLLPLVGRAGPPLDARPLLRLRHRRVQLLLQSRFGREEVAERQLRLAGMEPLGLVAEQPALQQRILVGKIRDGLLERGYLGPHLRLHANELALQRRQQTGHLLRRLRRWLSGRARHAVTYNDRDRASQQ